MELMIKIMETVSNIDIIEIIILINTLPRRNKKKIIKFLKIILK